MKSASVPPSHAPQTLLLTVDVVQVAYACFLSGVLMHTYTKCLCRLGV